MLEGDRNMFEIKKENNNKKETVWSVGNISFLSRDAASEYASFLKNLVEESKNQIELDKLKEKLIEKIKETKNEELKEKLKEILKEKDKEKLKKIRDLLEKERKKRDPIR